jgi:hypothetical protein
MMWSKEWQCIFRSGGCYCSYCGSEVAAIAEIEVEKR